MYRTMAALPFDFNSLHAGIEKNSLNIPKSFKLGTHIFLWILQDSQRWEACETKLKEIK